MRGGMSSNVERPRQRAHASSEEIPSMRNPLPLLFNAKKRERARVWMFAASAESQAKLVIIRFPINLIGSVQLVGQAVLSSPRPTACDRLGST